MHVLVRMLGAVVVGVRVLVLDMVMLVGVVRVTVGQVAVPVFVGVGSAVIVLF